MEPSLRFLDFIQRIILALEFKMKKKRDKLSSDNTGKDWNKNKSSVVL